MSGFTLALAALVIGLAITFLGFGIRRRDGELEAGVQILANMKWRDCISAILDMLGSDGYSQSLDPMASRTGSTEFLLAHGDDKVLVGYKHGTAYRITDANVSEFVEALHMRGAQRGILLTLGTTEPSADALATSCGVQLVAGRSLWQKLRPFVPPEALASASDQAMANSRRGLWVGTAASLLAGGAIYLLSNMSLVFAPHANASAVMSSTSPEIVAAGNASDFASQTAHSDSAMLKQLNATAEAMAAVAKLSPDEIARRRAMAAKDVALLPQIDSAAWSAQSTLLVRLNKTDGKDKVLIDEMCRILVQYEELRFTRVQMEPPSGANLPVRWRLCD